MGDILRVPKGYAAYRKKWLERLKRGEIKEEESKKGSLFYVA